MRLKYNKFIQIIWNFIKKITDSLSVEIRTFNGNKKIENKIYESDVKSPVQQAKKIINNYNISESKEKPVARYDDLSEEEKRVEELRIEQNRRNYKDSNDYSCL